MLAQTGDKGTFLAPERWRDETPLYLRVLRLYLEQVIMCPGHDLQAHSACLQAVTLGTWMWVPHQGTEYLEPQNLECSLSLYLEFCFQKGIPASHRYFFELSLLQIFSRPEKEFVRFNGRKGSCGRWKRYLDDIRERNEYGSS